VPVSRSRIVVRRVAALAVLALLVLALLEFMAGPSYPHRVSVTVPQATGMVPGLRVVTAGRKVGKVAETSVTPDGKARLVLEVDDEAWPLRTTSRVELRLGGTIKYTDRFVEVTTPNRGRPLEEGGVLRASQVRVPVEFDTLFNAFDEDTRKDLRSTIDTAGPTLMTAAPQLRRALLPAPAAVGEARAVVVDLKAENRSLDQLVKSANRVAVSIREANPELRQLIDAGATTFSATAQESEALRSTLSQAPATLAVARTTLARADGTLERADGLLDDIAPGVRELRRTSPVLTSLLGRVSAVAPDLKTTLATVRRAAPDLNGLLDRARSPLMGQLARIGREGAKQVSCIRPYSPEIAGLASTWTGIWGFGDGKDKTVRAQLGATPFTSEETVSSGTKAKQLGSGFSIAFPRPPGDLSNQPWFQPQCDITEDAYNPDKDPEAQAFDPFGKSVISALPDDSGKKATR
jgi:virulence factor Mce-like protein